VLHTKPNAWQTSFQWRQQCMVHILLHGNSYNRIVPGPRGFVDQLIPYANPAMVRPEQLDSGRILYHATDKTGRSEVLTQDDVLHFRGLSLDGVTGLSPIAYHRETLGMALAQQEYGARFYANDARPSGVLEHPGKFTKEETAQKLKDDWQRIYSGAGRHSIAVLQEGMKFNPMQMTHEDQQYIETRKFSVTDIARIFRVQPHLIGDLERSTYSNIEHQGLEFLTYTMMPWFVMWEQQIAADLILAPQTYYAEFLTDGLLRSDNASRMAAYAVGLNNGIYSPNEVRERENLNARTDPAGDAYLSPNNAQRSDQPIVQQPAPPQGAVKGIYLNGYGKEHLQ